MRIAKLLGVAGTDVPLSEIQALMTPYKVSLDEFKSFILVKSVLAVVDYTALEYLHLCDIITIKFKVMMITS